MGVSWTAAARSPSRDRRRTSTDAHEAAGVEDLRVAELVAHAAPISDRFDEARSSHGAEVLGGSRLAHPELSGDLVDLAATASPSRWRMRSRCALASDRSSDAWSSSMSFIGFGIHCSPWWRELSARA